MKLNSYSNDESTVVSKHDIELNNLFINSAIKKYTGIEPEFFIGNRFGKLNLPSNFIKIWEYNLRQVFTIGKPVYFKYNISFPHQDKFEMFTNIVPEIDTYGHVISAFGITQDATEWKEKYFQQMQPDCSYKMLFNSNLVSFGEMDAHGVLINANNKWLELLGYKRNQVVGKTMEYFIPDYHQAIFRERLSALKPHGTEKAFKMDMIDNSGDIINGLFEFNATYNTSNNTSRIYAIFKENLQQKKQEQMLANAIKNCEANQKANFAANLHDGLGPMLTSIKLFLRAMQSDMDKEKQTYFVNKVNSIIDDSIVTMKELVCKLNPSIIEKNGLNAALKNFFEKAGDSGVELVFDCDIKEKLCSKTETEIYRVVLELFNNSLKYACANKITIKLYRESDYVVLKYSDDGIGFDFNKVIVQNKGNGLRNIINRIRAFDAKYSIGSSIGNGFFFEAKILIP